LAFSEIIVVSVPDPAISGKAIGTTVAARTSFSLLKNSAPSTISSPRIKITIEPPTANERTSSPRRFKKGSPKNKKSTISAPAMIVARASRMPPIFDLSVIRMGIDPIISMIANKVKVTVKIASIPYCMRQS